MKIKRGIVAESAQFLESFKLRPALSRKRTAFCKLLFKDQEVLIEDTREIWEKYGFFDKATQKIKFKKDDDGNDTQEFDIQPEDMDSYKVELEELNDEDFVWSRTPDNAATYDAIKEILENYDEELEGRRAYLYEWLCEAFEVDDSIDFDESEDEKSE